MIVLVVDHKSWAFGRWAAGLARHNGALVLDQSEFRSFVIGRDLSQVNVCEFPWYESSTRMTDRCRRYTLVVGSHGAEYEAEDVNDWRTKIVTGNRNRREAERRLPRSSAVLCVNRRLVEVVNGISGNAVLAYPGVDTDLFRPLNSMKNSRLTIGWCGQRDGVTKGFREIWERLTEHFKGDKRFEFTTNRRTADDAVSAAEMCRWFNSLDLLVSTSFSEGFQGPPLEAMACGIPVLLTDIPGVPDVVKEHGGGCVVDGYHDVLGAEQTWKQMVSFIDTTDRDVLERMGGEALAAARRFSWRERAHEWTQAIEGRDENSGAVS